MDTIYAPVADYLGAAITWWANNPVQGIAAVGLLAAVVLVVALVLTVQDDRRRDDELLDRLGSATPGQPTSDLDALALAWRDEIEAKPFGDLVDTDTAITTIKAGAA